MPMAWPFPFSPTEWHSHLMATAAQFKPDSDPRAPANPSCQQLLRERDEVLAESLGILKDRFLHANLTNVSVPTTDTSINDELAWAQHTTRQGASFCSMGALKSRRVAHSHEAIQAAVYALADQLGGKREGRDAYGFFEAEQVVGYNDSHGKDAVLGLFAAAKAQPLRTTRRSAKA